jgi:hypothetical protein
VEVETLYVEPGCPWENGFAESFHSRLCDEFLALEVFESLAAARKLTAAWREDYNHHRPHGSLGYVTPAEFAARCTASAPKLLSATPPATSPLRPCSRITLGPSSQLVHEFKAGHIDVEGFIRYQ